MLFVVSSVGRVGLIIEIGSSYRQSYFRLSWHIRVPAVKQIMKVGAVAQN